jgi:glycosyltransferase involved in cell wall biosynthesis
VTPWLTVIIPSHEGQRWIATSLMSVAAQASDGIHVLIIDSSPTSASRDIAQSFSDRLCIRVLERRDLISWQAKSNFGVEVAESTHISWLGVDDAWLPGRASATKSWIDAAPQAPLHFAPSMIIDESGRKLGLWKCPLPAESALTPSFVTARLLVQNFVAAPAPVFRKDAWLGCGGLDENLWYSADWDIWLKLAACAPTYYHSEVTIGFRIHAGSLTVTGSRNSSDFTNQMTTILDRHLPLLRTDVRSVESIARASIVVNAALASASSGNFGGLLGAAIRVVSLGPRCFFRYLRYSRIVERVAPRLRAKFSGKF